jgi:hypothetical protein
VRNRDRTVAIVIKQVQPVGNVIAHVHVIKDPVTAAFVGAQAVAVTALVLAVTMMRQQSGISFPAAAPHNARILKDHVPAIRRSRGADVTVPTYEGVGDDVGIFNGPIGQTAGHNTRTQTMDINIFDKDVLTVRGHEPNQGPGTIGISVTVAFGRRVRSAVDTTGMICDVQTLKLHIAASLKAHDT